MERQSRRQYTADFKAQAVSLAESLGAAGAARKLGISSKTLANWIALARAGGVVGNSKRRPVSDLEAENTRLKAENAQLRMERDFLKNSAKPHAAALVYRNSLHGGIVAALRAAAGCSLVAYPVKKRFFSRFRGDWTRGVRRTVASANLVLPDIKQAGGRPWPQKSVFPPSADGKGMSSVGGARSAVARAAGAC